MGLARYAQRVKDIVYIRKINRYTDSKIYYKTVIDPNTKFEGMNTVYERCLLKGSSVGFMSYMGENCRLPKTKIGRYCAIASNVKVIYGEHPSEKFISIHDVFYSKEGYRGVKLCDKDLYEEYRTLEDYWFVEIGNDVWIAEDVRIMEGVRIGNGAIIGAGALVTMDVPDFAIVGGVPAKVIKYRFSEEDIHFLLQNSWWDKEWEWIQEHAGVFNDILKYKHAILTQN